MNIEHLQVLEISQNQGNIRTQFDNLKEFEALYQNIDLGIVVAKNNCLDYANNMFKESMQKVKDYQENGLLHLKAFRIFKKSQLSDQADSTESIEQLFSLADLIGKTNEFLQQNIFSIEIQDGIVASQISYKYFQIKVKNIITGKRILGQEFDSISQLIQVVDISDKILYSEVKAEHTFLEMINAAVSHELRNPLNSLIGQVCAMQDFFTNFKQILESMDQSIIKEKL